MPAQSKDRGGSDRKKEGMKKKRRGEEVDVDKRRGEKQKDTKTQKQVRYIETHAYTRLEKVEERLKGSLEKKRKKNQKKKKKAWMKTGTDSETAEL